MVQASPFQYSVGVQIICQIVDPQNKAIDISKATTLKFYIEKPSRKKELWNAELFSDGTDGKIQYITTSEYDLDEFGNYQIQAYVEDDNGKISTSVSRFIVKKGLLDLLLVRRKTPEGLLPFSLSSGEIIWITMNPGWSAEA